MGLFQLITSIYILGIIFATSGHPFLPLPAWWPRRWAWGRPAGAKKVMRYALCYAAIFGLTAMVCPLLQRGVHRRALAERFAHKYCPLRLFSIALPCIASSSAVSGYFIARRKAVITAAVNFVEQLIKIGATMAFIGMYLPRGLEYACAAVVIGGCIGEACSFVFLQILYQLEPAAAKSEQGGGRKHTAEAASYHPARGLLCLYRIDPSHHTAANDPLCAEKERRVQRGSPSLPWGMIQGMTMPVLMFPSVLLDATADLIVPELAECQAANRLLRLNYIIARVFNLCILLSVCVMWIFLRYSQELGLAIYNSTDVAYYIRILAPLIPFMYLDDVVDNMLKGIGETGQLHAL